MRVKRLCIALLIGCGVASTAYAGNLARIEVYDRVAARTLPLHLHGGRLYVAGEPGHDYEIRIHNRAAGRLLAVTSVDGVNVITGETAAPGQSGYVLDPWQTLAIGGWRKSLDQVARFYFTALPDSYAARTGRPDDVGVIGVAVFRPRAACCTDRIDRDTGRAARAPAAAEGQADAGLHRETEPRLGTGHGQREHSPAGYTQFERASSEPDETIVVHYDSYQNLIARGIIAVPQPYAERHPDPFPARFVPDP